MTNAERIRKVREALEELRDQHIEYVRDSHELVCDLCGGVGSHKIGCSVERATDALALLTVEVDCESTSALIADCGKCDGNGKVSVPLEETL